MGAAFSAREYRLRLCSWKEVRHVGGGVNKIAVVLANSTHFLVSSFLMLTAVWMNNIVSHSVSLLCFQNNTKRTILEVLSLIGRQVCSLNFYITRSCHLWQVYLLCHLALSFILFEDELRALFLKIPVEVCSWKIWRTNASKVTLRWIP